MSWSFGELKRRVVVMWDVPFFQSHNILAVGISTTENTVHKENWYTEIEKLSQSSDLNYSRERNTYSSLYMPYTMLILLFYY
jgi:hypothetical protein